MKPKGAWFRRYDAEGDVTAEIRVGVADPFVPALKAHPALPLEGVSNLEEVATRLSRPGRARRA